MLRNTDEILFSELRYLKAYGSCYSMESIMGYLFWDEAA